MHIVKNSKNKKVLFNSVIVKRLNNLIPALRIIDLVLQKDQLLNEEESKFNYNRVNISEEVNKTGMWLQVRRSSTREDSLHE